MSPDLGHGGAGAGARGTAMSLASPIGKGRHSRNSPAGHKSSHLGKSTTLVQQGEWSHALGTAQHWVQVCIFGVQLAQKSSL